MYAETFCGRKGGGYKGVARIARFVDLREEVKGWGARLGIEEKEYVTFGYTLRGVGSGDVAGEFNVEGLGEVRGKRLVG